MEGLGRGAADGGSAASSYHLLIIRRGWQKADRLEGRLNNDSGL